MFFQYLPYKFASVPDVYCAFQMRTHSSYNNICNIAIKEQNYGDYSINSATKNCLDGNISYSVDDIAERVQSTRHAMQNFLGFEHFAEIHQVHGEKIIFDPSPSTIAKSPLQEADGLATDKQDFALMVKSADCQPIMVVHKDGKHIMALHVGWRGNKLHFPRNAIDKFCEFYRLSPADLYAVRGPSLGSSMAEFTDFDKDWPEEFKVWYNQKTKCMDLWGLTFYQLSSAGLKHQNIFSLDFCTATMHKVFFSYRYNKNCGRLANLIWIAKPSPL